MKIELATLGGGCFWCLEAVYEQMQGILSVSSGYAGGTPATANYSDVCSGTTDHVEVIQIKYNAEEVTYSEILDVFWTIHDPTTLNRQGNDVGPQYRSAIFYHNDAQKAIAEKSKASTASEIWNDAVVTEILPLETFFKAETNHQGYYAKTGDRNPYCSFVITPKVVKFRKQFSDRLKERLCD